MAKEATISREGKVNPINAVRRSRSSIDVMELRNLGLDIRDVYTILRSDGLSESEAKDELRASYADLLTDEAHRRVIDRLKG